jgi:hypothetical protein
MFLEDDDEITARRGGNWQVNREQQLGGSHSVILPPNHFRTSTPL